VLWVGGCEFVGGGVEGIHLILYVRIYIDINVCVFRDELACTHTCMYVSVYALTIRC
jgi:hypothetical protein